MTKQIWVRIGGTALLAAVAGLWSIGCRSETARADGGGAALDTGKGGAQLWSENCARCHNVRSPASYSDGDWSVSMHHMRVRANLTAEEHVKILEFLKSGN